MTKTIDHDELMSTVMTNLSALKMKSNLRDKAMTPNQTFSQPRVLEDSFSDYIEKADAFILDVKKDSIVKINEKL